jgi:predicted DNA-binding antitoxin AbrB/MazE fold protein
MNNTIINKLICGLIFLSILASPAAAEITSAPITDPSFIGVGARPLGMGKAGVALSDDANTIFLNPAGLGSINRLLLTSMYTTLMGDVNYMVAGGAFPIGDGSTLGLGVINSQVSDIPFFEADGTPAGNGGFGSHVGLLSYGYNFGEANSTGRLSNSLKNLSLGITGKYFMQTGSGGSDAKLATGSGTSIDVGLLYSPRSGISIGLTGQNLLGSKMAYGSGAEIDIPKLIKIGGKANFKKFIVAADMDMFDSYSLLHAGIEYRPNKMLAVRAGVDQDAVGEETISNMTLGVGFRFEDFQFDYAYHPYSDIEENTTHFFSISFTGEEREPDERIADLTEGTILEGPRERRLSLARPERTKRLKLVSFIDVHKGYWARAPIELLATAGLVEGYPNGTFKPERTLTRAELATLLVRAANIPVDSSALGIFKDVPRSHWAVKYIEAAKDAGLVKGYPDGTFKPNAQINREEGVTIMVRLESLEEVAEELTEQADDSRFVDIKGSWAAGYIMAADEIGLLDYLNNTERFRPKSGFSRAEAAETLSKTSLGQEEIDSLFAAFSEKEIASLGR